MADGAARMIRLKRVFDKKSPDDGFRVLVDRKWPLGVRKEAAALDYWAKELAPSDELREFFRFDLKRWNAFREGLRNELNNPVSITTLARLGNLAKSGTVTLVFASREPVKNNATVVKELLEAHFS